MKYFIGKVDGLVDCEVTSDFAFKMYLKNAGKGKRYLVAHPNYNKGVKIRLPGAWLWGENISNKELFKRRLNGQVAKEVIKE